MRQVSPGGNATVFTNLNFTFASVGEDPSGDSQFLFNPDDQPSWHTVGECDVARSGLH